MSFLVFHVLTVVLSIMMKKGMDFNFLKRVGKLGYKVNLEENEYLVSDVKHLVRNIKNNDNEFVDRFILLLPGINMIDCIYEAKIYSDIIEEVIDKTKEVNAIVKMNDEEKNIFMQKPTGFTAWLMLNKEYVERELIQKIIIKDANEEIYYTYNDVDISYDNDNDVLSISIENLKIKSIERKTKALKDQELKEIVLLAFLTFIEDVTKDKTIEELENTDVQSMLKEGIIFDIENIKEKQKNEEIKIMIKEDNKRQNRNKYTVTLSPKKEELINDSNKELTKNDITKNEVLSEKEKNIINDLEVSNEEKNMEKTSVKKLVRKKENDNKKDK